MGLSRVLLLFLSHLLISSQTLAQSGPYSLQYTSCSNNLVNYTTDSPYKRNLNTLLSSLASDYNQADYGFYNFSVGQSPDQVNSIALCRGDVSLNDCRGCIINSTRQIVQDCPNQKEAIRLFDFCMALYSSRSLDGIIEGFVPYHSSNLNDVSDPSTFKPALRDLLFRIRDVAASGNSLRKFATGNQKAGFYTIYGLAQCTPNLSQQQCSDCLDGIIPQVQDCCSGKLGGRVITPSCNLRFENKRFYEETPPGKKSNTTRTIIIVVISLSAAILVACICFLIITRLKKYVGSGNEPQEAELHQINDLNRAEQVDDLNSAEQIDDLNSAGHLRSSFEQIRTATNNFSENNKIGEDGFGFVYEIIASEHVSNSLREIGLVTQFSVSKCQGILDERKVAVKRLRGGSTQGDPQFKIEVAVLAKVEHKNLVKLLGFCSDRNERLLVYEFVPNKSLDKFIFDPVKRANLDWKKSYEIICGIASGLRFLHQVTIIHRDMKANNVLLDKEMNPKISDFGLAKLLDQSPVKASKFVGTDGYIAPEYIRCGYLSVKTDVYSYAVLVLEILTGQENSHFCIDGNEENLLNSAWKTWDEGTCLNLLDPKMRIDGSMTEMVMRCFQIALLCVQEVAADRPTMADVDFMLSSQSYLPTPSKPPIFKHSSTFESDMSSSVGYLPSKTQTAPFSKSNASINQPYSP